MKKRLVALFSFIIIFSSLIIAQDSGIDECVDNCKNVTCKDEGEECRSKCIGGCKVEFGIDEDFGKELRCLQCGDSCAPYDFVVVASCVKPTKILECGSKDGECVILSSQDIEGDIELNNEGITPDNAFYFIDKFFDRFGDDLEVREEKVSEIKAMIEKGDIESAKEALRAYMHLAQKLEKEVDPAKKDEAVKSIFLVKETIRELEKDIPEEDKTDFVEGVIEQEESIGTAVEIANKIKELCQTLSEVDPEKYKEVCKSDDDSPKWQKKLDGKLTDEQRKEAKEFGKIMEQCFKTSGQDCRCEDISFIDFSVACEKASGLAVACETKGDENACEELSGLNMPRLPDYLQDVFDDVEDRYSEDKFDMHMPPECVEAGVKSPKECGKIMIKEHAPPECRAALLEADIDSEREGREICDKIMFEKHSPKECIDKGITNPEECATFMDSYRGPMGEGPGGFGPLGANCMEIQNSDERLKCFEDAVSGTGEHYGTDPKFEGGGEITWQCKEHRIHWAPDCEKFMKEEWPELEMQKQEKLEMERKEREDYENLPEDCKRVGAISPEACDKHMRDVEALGPGCDDCASKCPGASRTDCVNDKCECYYDKGGDGSYEESECKDGCSDECPGASRTDCVDGGTRCACYYEDEGDGGGDTEPSPSPEPSPAPVEEPTTSPDSDSSGSDSGISDSGSSDSGSVDSGDSGSDSGSSDSGGSDSSSDSGSSDSGDSGSDSGSSDNSGETVTGNLFLDYWYG